VGPGTSAAGDAKVADATVPDQKLYVVNKERAARTANVVRDEGQSLGALAAMLTPGGGQQAEACGLAHLAMKCVEDGTSIALFDVPIIWNWFDNDEQQEKQASFS
jgi:hypothetical protein